MTAPTVMLLGGRQVGCIGLLTLRASGCEVLGVVAYDESVHTLATCLELPSFRSVHEAEVIRMVARVDLLVCVHGREMIPENLLRLPRYGGINVHPCLSGYKGANPIERLLRDGNPRASVGVHRMTSQLDSGEVVVEEFVDVSGLRTIEEVYNRLYPLYAVALLKALAQVGATAHARALLR